MSDSGSWCQSRGCGRQGLARAGPAPGKARMRGSMIPGGLEGGLPHEPETTGGGGRATCLPEGSDDPCPPRCAGSRTGAATSPHLTSPHLTSPHLTSPHLTSPHLLLTPPACHPLPTMGGRSSACQRSRFCSLAGCGMWASDWARSRSSKTTVPGHQGAAIPGDSRSPA